MTRDLIVVDVETNGLNPDEHIVLEIAAINGTTGERIHIIPNIPPSLIAAGDPKALQVNRYFERGLFAQTTDNLEEIELANQLWEWLRGNTLAGANPRFDLEFLTKYFVSLGFEAPKPHHRLADISAYAAGAAGLDPCELPGLSEVCSMFDITNHEPHTAMGDAEATFALFRTIQERISA